MRYYVYRHGWNTANHPSRDNQSPTARVAEVTAKSEDEACQLAAKRVTVYNNQYLYAESAAAVDAREAEVDNLVKAL